MNMTLIKYLISVSEELPFKLMMSYRGNVSLQHMLMGQMQLVWCIAKAEGFSLFFILGSCYSIKSVCLLLDHMHHCNLHSVCLFLWIWKNVLTTEHIKLGCIQIQILVQRWLQERVWFWKVFMFMHRPDCHRFLDIVSLIIRLNPLTRRITQTIRKIQFP